MSFLLPFKLMVLNLFKCGGYVQAVSDLIHAAIGVVGEVIEHRFSESEENTVEEAGDLEFYIEAALQQLQKLFPLLDKQVDLNVLFLNKIDQSYSVMSTWDARMLEDTMLAAAGGFLDFCKKLWVYNKPATDQMAHDMLNALAIVAAALRLTYKKDGTTREAVIAYNQNKLGKRYPEGVYRDADAQARADKEVQVERKKPDSSEGGEHD